MTPSIESKFNHYYSRHCKHLKLKGLQPKTIEAYSRAIRRIGGYFDGHLDDLSQDQSRTTRRAGGLRKSPRRGLKPR